MAHNDTTDYDDLVHFRDGLRAGLTATAVLCSFLTLVNIGLLLTALSKPCRAISANWYIYCIHAMIMLYGFILVIGLSSPAFYRMSGCMFLYNFNHLVQLLYSLAVVMTNIEVYRTIICPKQGWTGHKIKRFTLATILIVFVSLTIVTITGTLSTRMACSGIYYMAVEAALHILKNWIPGLACIVLFIMNIVEYVKLRRRGINVYNQFVENSPVAVKPTEWFVCIVGIDIIYIVFEILFVHLPLTATYRPEFWVIKLLERLLLLCLGLPVLALSHVRKTILVFWRGQCHRRHDAVPVAEQDTNCDAIEDESL